MNKVHLEKAGSKITFSFGCPSKSVFNSHCLLPPNGVLSPIVYHFCWSGPIIQKIWWEKLLRPSSSLYTIQFGRKGPSRSLDVWPHFLQGLINSKSVSKSILEQELWLFLSYDPFEERWRIHFSVTLESASSRHLWYISKPKDQWLNPLCSALINFDLWCPDLFGNSSSLQSLPLLPQSALTLGSGEQVANAFFIILPHDLAIWCKSLNRTCALD